VCVASVSRFVDSFRDSTASSGKDAEANDVSRAQLDSLIEAGDWAAVGATAALLAAASSDSQSVTSDSRASHSRVSRGDGNSLDAARAAELDHLVDAGDWEGVVLAAAKFEAESAQNRSDKSGTNSSVESGTDSAGTGTGTGTAGSPSVGTSTSESPSKAAKRAEIREEVEALVRRVVPEEIDNIDEMMNQFQGREEELVETLRTMQERAVAQKARSAGQKAAKVEARKSVQRGVVPGTGTTQAESTSRGASQLIAATSGVNDVVPGPSLAGRRRARSPEVEGRKLEAVTPSSPFATEGGDAAEAASLQHRTALEMAIESGDWEAVGEAAAMMSDASITTASTGEVERIAGTHLSDGSSAGSKGRALLGVKSESNRAAELDELISRGDWQGVMEAAALYSQADRSGTAVAGDADIQSQEEKEALAQAELWMKIAEQKKKEGATDAGASDAAEWAIQRTLSQLREAERTKEKAKKKQQDEDEV
jgi:hypothetical protein